MPQGQLHPPIQVEAVVAQAAPQQIKVSMAAAAVAVLSTSDGRSDDGTFCESLEWSC
jgi:hypothetical protein